MLMSSSTTTISFLVPSMDQQIPVERNYCAAIRFSIRTAGSCGAALRGSHVHGSVVQQGRGKAHQIGERMGAEFAHQFGAAGLDRALAQVEVEGQLFVEPPRHDAAQDDEFALIE